MSSTKLTLYLESGCNNAYPFHICSSQRRHVGVLNLWTSVSLKDGLSFAEMQLQRKFELQDN